MRRVIAVSVAVLVTIGCVAETPPAGMVFVRGGSFDMGVAQGEDNPLHRVRVDDFWMARYEVTVKEWRDFTAAEGGWSHWNKFYFTSVVGRNIGFDMPDDWAMYWISWYQAVRYCNWRSAQEGLQVAYAYDEKRMQDYLAGRARTIAVQWDREANGYRLPTEAEWEYAARGGFGGRGRAYPDGVALADIAWFRDNSEWEVHPVGQKQPNVLGLYDMLGNVGEWCWDYYRPDSYRTSPRVNPVGPDSGHDPENFAEDARDIRVNRGSTWMDDESHSTEVFRFRSEATNTSAVGIRLVRSAQ